MPESDRLRTNASVVEAFFHNSRKKRKPIEGSDRIAEAIRKRLQKPDAHPKQQPTEDEGAGEP